MRTPTGFSKCADGALNNNAFQMSEHEAEKTYQRSPISAREILDRAQQKYAFTEAQLKELEEIICSCKIVYLYSWEDEYI